MTLTAGDRKINGAGGPGFRMLYGMLIEAFPRDREALIALGPEYAGPRMPVPLTELKGREIPAPDGVTVRYEGATLYRSAELPPELGFLLTIVAGVPTGLVVQWIVGHFRGRTERVTINRRVINLDDEGQVRQIVEEEVTREPAD